MKIISFKVFQGRNIYSHKKCIRLNLDLEGYSEIPSKEINGFNENLIKMLPGLKNHRCGIDERGGFVKRLEEGTYIAHICEHIIIELHNYMGFSEICYGKARQISGDYYYVIFQYEYERAGIETAFIAVEIINSLIYRKKLNLANSFDRLKKMVTSEMLGVTTQNICMEAKKRGIPVLKISGNSMFQLGYGKNSKRIEAAIGSETSVIAVDIAQDKLLTKEILSTQFIPVAKGWKVMNLEDAINSAEEIQYPIVLKPQFGNQGKGVFANIKGKQELISTYNSIFDLYKDIIIEKYIDGRDYRVCMVYGEVAAVAERIPPYVLGDGISSIKELIEKLNSSSKRGEDHEKELTKIKIDKFLINYLERKSYTLESVLPKKKKLTLKDNGNLSTGGFAIDCTDLICDDNIEICKRAARAIDLDICGIDIICNDISKSMEVGGAVIEVNAAPGIRMHHKPYLGIKRNVAGKIVEALFKDIKENIPVISITGTNGKTTTTRLVSHILKLNGLKVGMTTTSGIYIGGKCILKGDTTGPKSALAVLTNKEVEAAVLETARGGIIRQGLAYDLADVGVITNITEDHLGIDEVETLEDLGKVKALVGEAVKDDGYVVINGDDRISISILNRFKSKLIVFSRNKENRVMKENIKKGGYGIYVDKDDLIIEKRDCCCNLINIKDIGITMRGILKYNIENAMAACGAAIGIGVDYSVIKRGLQTFYSNEVQNPGRFNIYDVNGITVILDYGHNIEGYKCVLEGVSKLKRNMLIGVVGVPGDRLDSDIIKIGKCASKKFDYIFIKEDEDKRGRKEKEVAKLLKDGILSTGFDEVNLEIVLNEKEAFERAVQFAKPGDIVITFFEKEEPIKEIIKNKVNGNGRKDKFLVKS